MGWWKIFGSYAGTISHRIQENIRTLHLHHCTDRFRYINRLQGKILLFKNIRLFSEIEDIQ